MLHAPWSRRPGPCRPSPSPCFGSRQSSSSPGSLRCRGSRSRSLPPQPARGVSGPGPRDGYRGAEPRVAGTPRAWARRGVEPVPPWPGTALVTRPREARHTSGAGLRAARIGNRRGAPPPLRRAVPAGSLMPPPPPPGCSPLGSGESSLAGGTAAERGGQAVIPRRGQGG